MHFLIEVLGVIFLLKICLYINAAISGYAQSISLSHAEESPNTLRKELTTVCNYTHSLLLSESNLLGSWKEYQFSNISLETQIFNKASLETKDCGNSSIMLEKTGLLQWYLILRNNSIVVNACRCDTATFEPYKQLPFVCDLEKKPKEVLN